MKYMIMEEFFFRPVSSCHPDETPESLAKKIHALEYKHYPEQIARWMESC